MEAPKLKEVVGAAASDELFAPPNTNPLLAGAGAATGTTTGAGAGSAGLEAPKVNPPGAGAGAPKLKPALGAGADVAPAGTPKEIPVGIVTTGVLFAVGSIPDVEGAPNLACSLNDF